MTLPTRRPAPAGAAPAHPPTTAGARPDRVPALLEGLLVVVAAVATVLWNDRGVLADATRTVPGNLGDPLYFAWQLAWVAHAISTDPGSLWTTNAFSRAPDNLAYTDTMLGYLPIGLLTGAADGGQGAALATLNVAGFLAGVLALCGGYALARALGAGPAGSLVAGAGFGLAPWRVEQAIHLNVISTGGIALTLALLCHGHGWSLRHGWRPDRVRPWAVAAGWAVACWQITLGFATGIVFGYVLAGICALWAAGWLLAGRPALPRALLAAEAAGGAAFVLVTFLLTRPYLRVLEANPTARRSEAMLDLFSPPPSGLRLSSATSWFWGDRQAADRAKLSWPPEMIVSPGHVLAALAVLGLFVSVWPLRRRLALAVATAVTTVLMLGTQAVGGGEWTYLLLYRHLPGWDALRTPGRLVIWVTLGLALLAAGFVGRLARLLLRPAPGTPTPARRDVRLAAGVLALAVPTALVGADGWGGPRHWPVAPSPVVVPSVPAPLMFLPTDLVGDYHLMLWSTDGWPTLANGSSGFDPPSQTRLRQDAETFPDAASVAALRARGVRTVVLVRSRAAGSPWEGAADRPVEGLGLERLDLGDAVVFRLG
jgi:hypothetical protein